MYENVVFFMLPIFLIYAKFFFFHGKYERMYLNVCMYVEQTPEPSGQGNGNGEHIEAKRNETETNRI